MTATYYFRNTDDGRTFFVKGPDSLTKQHAQRIFDQQRSAGALIALKTGQTITPEYQLSNGLTTAQSAVSQDIKLSVANVEININSVTTPVTNGINIADYAKQTNAQIDIKNISKIEVTGVLAQVKNLTNQAATEATNLGAGKYALTVSQLERAGYIKPGTTLTYMSSGLRSTLTVLNMPEVWTGKNGISGLQQLLSNADLQDNIQQFLMNKGLDQLAEVGVPVENMPAKHQAGLALLAAIDPDLAVGYVNNKTVTPIPVYGSLPADAVTDWQYPDRIVRDAAFAVEFSKNKLNNAMRNEVTEFTDLDLNAESVVERQVLNFAADQIVGNDKVAKFGYGSVQVPAALQTQFAELAQQQVTLNQQITAVLAQTPSVSTASVTQSQLVTYRKQLVELNAKFGALISEAENTAPVSQQFLTDNQTQRTSIQNLVVRIDQTLRFIAQIMLR